MNLEILSLNEAQKFVPKDRTHMIRIFGAFDFPMYYPLDHEEDFASISSYYFDDMWPRDFKEYSWVDCDDAYFSGVSKMPWKEVVKKFPKITKESFMGYLESVGHPEGRCTLFSPEVASKLIGDFEKVKENIDTIAIHCRKGKNRSPAVGIFMNEYYDLGHEGLKEKHFEYRRFVYETMKETFEE